MYRNRLTLVFCAVLIFALALPGQMSPVRAAGPASLLLQLDTETPTPTETETPTESPTETMTVTPTETPTATETLPVTDTVTPTETQSETATPTETESPTGTMTATETVTPTLTATETATPTATATATITATRTPTRTATPPTSNRYVATYGVDTGNCDRPIAPCRSINYALGRAFSGNTIYITQGMYTGTGTEVVLINKSITLFGGWNAGFTVRGGLSVIDGQAARRVITNNANPVILHYLQIQHGLSSIGAGIINLPNGMLTLNNSFVNDNVGPSSGAGIYNYGTLTSNNNTIRSNVSTNGAGGIHNQGILLLNSSTLSGNKTSSYGSAIINDSNKTATINNSTISGNTGGNGSILNLINGQMNINNSTISGNHGGVYNNNHPQDNGYAYLRNSILAGNNPIAQRDDCRGYITSKGYNLIGNTLRCGFTASTGDQIGTDAKPIYPQLGPLQNNGGPTFTRALLGTSPALNAGNPAVVGSGSNACLATDQRGNIRAGNGGCDIGAYEITIPIVTVIKRVNPSPTNKSLVSFLVTFSEQVSGIEKTAPFSDFSLTTTGLTGASVTSVIGSGKIYQVTVNTGRGNGTLRLDVIDDDSIKDSAGNPLGGVGVGNGTYKTGEAYTVQNTQISSITLANANPTSASKVDFILRFSENVTGVRTVAPFSDFSLTTVSITGVSIASVVGSGTTYTITVNTGSGNGSIQLNVRDYDNIKDDSGTPLGGIGIGNGNYTSTAYNILTIPIPNRPTFIISELTPSYDWSVIPGATQYQYEVFKDTTLLYTNIVNSNICGINSCSDHPIYQLTNGDHKWHVRAMINGAWKAYSSYQSFKVFIPNAGFWKGDTDFYITPDSKYVTHYKFYIDVPSCNIYGQTLIIDAYVPIEFYYQYYYANDFTHVYFRGSFNTPTSASGYFALNGYYLPGCGPIYGQFNTYHYWQNSSQPTVNSGIFTLTPGDAAVHPGSVFTLQK